MTATNLTGSEKTKLLCAKLQTTVNGHYEYKEKTKTGVEKINMQILSVEVVDGKVRIKGKRHDGKGFYNIVNGKDFARNATPLKVAKNAW